jgi:hypothetical protein
MKSGISAEPQLAKLSTPHCQAICDEIGYRLRLSLRPTSSDLPPQISALLSRLVMLDQDASPTIPVAARIHLEAGV